jgi:WD40 repeat protein
MTPNAHRVTRRCWTSRVCGSIVFAFVLGGLLLLAGASDAAAYTFTPVAGSPFSTGMNQLAPHQVVFSPNGALLVDTSFNEVFAQTVSKGGVVGAPGGYLGPDACKPQKGIPINTGHIDSVAYSRNGALLAEVEEPATGKGTGTLRIYRVRGKRLFNDSCRTLPYTGKNPTPEPYYSVAFGPAGLLAVTNVGKNTVSVYSVTKAGKTHPVSTFATGKDPDAVAFGPTRSGGEALATADWGANNVSTFTISSGFVAPAAGSPFATLAGPSSVAFSPTGVLAVAGSGANQVNVYTVNFVAQLSGSGAAHTDGQPLSVAFSTTGRLLASADSSDVSVFSVATSGLLAPVSGSPFSPPGPPVSIAFDHHAFLLALAFPALTGETGVYSYAAS